jgi:acyl carrier protein
MMATLTVLLAVTGHGPARGQERAASRRALRLLGAALGPAAVSTSVSHARGASVAAAAVGSRASIGVDLEEDRTSDPRTGRFFLQEHELAWLGRVAAREAEHVRLWTVKEALFKSDPDNARTILLSYALCDPGALAGHARREPGVRFCYRSARLGERHLSVAACLADGPARPDTSAEAGQPADRSTMNTETTGQEFTAEAAVERIAELLAVPVAELTPQTLISDLVRESFMLVELVIDLQEEFGTYFSQHELREIETIGELVALLGASRRA